MNKTLISQACARRLVEVRERVNLLDPHRYGEMSEYVSSLRDALPNDSGLTAPERWMEADVDCLASLRALSLGGPIISRQTAAPPVDAFFQSLETAMAERRSFFDLL